MIQCPSNYLNIYFIESSPESPWGLNSISEQFYRNKKLHPLKISFIFIPKKVLYVFEWRIKVNIVLQLLKAAARCCRTHCLNCKISNLYFVINHFLISFEIICLGKGIFCKSEMTRTFSEHVTYYVRQILILCSSSWKWKGDKLLFNQFYSIEHVIWTSYDLLKMA